MQGEKVRKFCCKKFIFSQSEHPNFENSGDLTPYLMFYFSCIPIHIEVCCGWFIMLYNVCSKHPKMSSTSGDIMSTLGMFST